MSRSTFSVLFYVNRGKEKNGVVPVMGRVTINGTQIQFSCKKSIPLTLWDAKGNCAKGRSKEALQLNRDLDNIKAQIIKHYQHLADREAFVTAEMVRNSYQGFGSEYETLLNAFDRIVHWRENPNSLTFSFVQLVYIEDCPVCNTVGYFLFSPLFATVPYRLTPGLTGRQDVLADGIAYNGDFTWQ